MTDCEVNRDLIETLETVLAYREGRKPFDFHRLPDDQRANEAFDAWHRVETKIRGVLARAKAA